MQTDKWQNQLKEFEESLESDEEDSESKEELDEVLEVKLNKVRRSRLVGEDLENEGESYTTVLAQRLHREPTARTKRAQKMQAAYCRSVGMGSYTPDKAGYIKVDQPKGGKHWTIRR